MDNYKHKADKTIRKGKYRHYKGREYQVFGVTRHTEREEWLVSYRGLYGDHSCWVRPFDMFVGSVVFEGKDQARFAYLCPCDEKVLSIDHINEG